MFSRYTRLMQALRGWRALAPATISAIIVACGGGYGSGGSSYVPPAGSAPAGVSVGAITGFGSVHLNGRKFETTSTTIHVDGQDATQSDLHVGDVIEVRGHHDDASGKDVADVIEMHSNVQGPVASIDTTAQELVVLGQNVQVSASTTFDPAISPASLAGIQVGDILRVSGMPAANGDIQATRIARLPAGSAFHVIGIESATDAAGKKLDINALVVDYSGATLEDFPSTGPADGDKVEASGTSLDASGALIATRLELRDGKDLQADHSGEGEVEGLVTRFASATDFDVAGRPVSTSAATVFDGGSASDIALNLHVEAEGSVDASGVLAATRVRIEREADARIVAQVDAVDTTAGTVTMLGVKVGTGAMTRFEDRSNQHVDKFNLSNVHAGDWLEVRGVEGSDKSVAATRLERRDAAPAVMLAGLVDTAAQPALSMLGVQVSLGAVAQFTDAQGKATDATTFFTGLAGQHAIVVGSWDGTTLTGSSASLGGTESGSDGN
jgi:hypothetical protein